MENELYVVLRRPFILGGNEPKSWESLGYFRSQELAIESLAAGTSVAVKPEYNIGDLFAAISVDYISDIEKAQSLVFILNKDRIIDWTIHCFELESISWFSGWEGSEANPEKLIKLAFGAGIPNNKIVLALAECILAALDGDQSQEAKILRSSCQGLVEFGMGRKINFGSFTGALSTFYPSVNRRLLFGSLRVIFQHAETSRSHQGYEHPIVRSVLGILHSMPKSVDGRVLMVDIINRHIPLSSLFLTMKSYDE